MNRGNLFIISGPSGTGKGTICKSFDNADDVFLSVSVTTRNRRNDEIDGVTYIYDTVEGFKNRIKEDLMLEWAQYGENYYGTPREVVEEKLNNGINVILEIDVQGALKVKEKMPDAIMIFVVPPSMGELRNRLLLRARESEEEIQKRISFAKNELQMASVYNYIVVNDNLEESITAVRNIIDKRKRAMTFVNNLLQELEE